MKGHIEVRGICPLISVFNMPRSLAFYRDLLGFQIVSDSGNGDDSSWVWIRLNEADLMLNDQYEPGHVPDAPPSERQKWHHDTCLYLGADPDVVYEYLTSRGIELKPPKDAPYGMRQLYLNDPDGYNLCFQSPVEPAK
jgi:catechol 2,3-dioxygenase-like lactoylglutathione lyase family enzyme